MKTAKVMLVLLAAVSVLAACIKEDRDGCPCRLVLDFDGVDTSVVKNAVLSLTSDDGFAFSGSVDLPVPEGYMITVPRSRFRLCAWAGTGYCLNNDMSVVIPYGEDCPRAFLHVSEVEADCERLDQKVSLKKNHCVLTIQVEEGQEYPFTLVVKGKINGYGADQRPSVGDFSCRAIPDAQGRCVVVLPRQLDSSLKLEVDDGKESLKTFSIGESIVAEGYDWEADDLDDVTMMLNYSLTEVTLDVAEWTEELVYDVVI